MKWSKTLETIRRFLYPKENISTDKYYLVISSKIISPSDTFGSHKIRPTPIYKWDYYHGLKNVGEVGWLALKVADFVISFTLIYLPKFMLQNKIVISLSVLFYAICRELVKHIEKV
jgi:hypothetical protein